MVLGPGIITVTPWLLILIHVKLVTCIVPKSELPISTIDSESVTD